ncbi:hypothetical protein FE257_000037 [Aspergillus nanangensis]|uniref:Uncharacterized protein n=1 Tax=Aspergillus nanangensis TaxID=2582783 RepID=A0AAD4GZV0_ASPNN|nr:hypothetical protein FE257_000037 [Aspergillus nanangensis]
MSLRSPSAVAPCHGYVRREYIAAQQSLIMVIPPDSVRQIVYASYSFSLSLDGSKWWVQNLKDAEKSAGREGMDPLWDLFRCIDDWNVEFIDGCPGECAFRDIPGEYGCV